MDFRWRWWKDTTSRRNNVTRSSKVVKYKVQVDWKIEQWKGKERAICLLRRALKARRGLIVNLEENVVIKWKIFKQLSFMH